MNRCIVLCLALALAAPAAAASRGDKDLILLGGGRTPIEGYVQRETVEKVYYKTWPTTPDQDVRTGEVVEIFYYGMDHEGPWKAGLKDKAGGQYAVAATRFQSLSDGGTKEWEKTYGLYQAGECWELAGEFTKAATCFGSLASAYPEHRLVLDAQYRQGVCLARAKKPDEARAVAKGLIDWSEKNQKEKRSRMRAFAIEAASYAEVASKGDSPEMTKAYEIQRKTAFSPSEKAIGFHWSLYWAGMLRNKSLWDEAAQSYQRMLGQVGDDTVLAAKVSIGYGVCLARAGNKERALYELLKMDCLPYGSPEERAEAQFHAGKLMWETAQDAIKSSAIDKDEKRLEYAKAKEKQAREMLRGLKAGVTTWASKAGEVLDTLPPDPEEEAARKAAEEKATQEAVEKGGAAPATAPAPAAVPPAKAAGKVP